MYSSHYKIELPYYYLSGSTPTPFVEKTPTPQRTPSPIPTPTPYPTPSEEINFFADETPTPSQTMIGIDGLNFEEDVRFLLEVVEIEDAPLNTNTINYSSDLDQKTNSNLNCGEIVTGQMSNDVNNLVDVRLLISDGHRISVWTETPEKNKPK